MFGENAVRRPAGYIRIDGDGPVVEHDTMQCVHCGAHWIVVPGSGRTRGWCMRCNGPHCGGQACWECIPEEVKIYGGR